MREATTIEKVLAIRNAPTSSDAAAIARSKVCRYPTWVFAAAALPAATSRLEDTSYAGPRAAASRRRTVSTSAPSAIRMSASDAPLPSCRSRCATGSRTRASVEFGGPSPSPKPARPTTRNRPSWIPWTPTVLPSPILWVAAVARSRTISSSAAGARPERSG